MNLLVIFEPSNSDFLLIHGCPKQLIGLLFLFDLMQSVCTEGRLFKAGSFLHQKQPLCCIQRPLLVISIASPFRSALLVWFGFTHLDYLCTLSQFQPSCHSTLFLTTTVQYNSSNFIIPQEIHLWCITLKTANKHIARH